MTEAYTALHALLLTATPTRAAATRQVIQHLLQTSQHLPSNKLVSSATTAAVDGSNSSIGQAGGGDAGDDSGNGDISGGASKAGDELQDQLAGISSGVAALEQAVATHQDGDVCGEIWKQLVHLAAPAGQCNVMLSLHQHHTSHHQLRNCCIPAIFLQHSYCIDLHENPSQHASVLAIEKISCH